MQKYKMFEPHLWAVIAFGLGIIFHAGFSYVVVEVNPVSTSEALLLINEKIEDLENNVHATEFILDSNMNCQPVFKNTVEKRCTQQAAVVFSNGSIHYGSCTTWSYKGFFCNFPLVSRTGDVLANTQFVWEKS